jgi:hypothetical protein
MKEKREQEKHAKGALRTEGKKEDRRKEDDHRNEQRNIMERHLRNKASKRGYHPDGPGGSYDGL